MKVLAIDPGTTHSAFVQYDELWVPSAALKGKIPNEELLSKLRSWRSCKDVQEHIVVIEMIASYGMAVGREVFETCVWIGRFMEAWGPGAQRLFRRDVKLNLCHTGKARDANIRQALIDRFGPPGTKAAPGGTYGYKADIWAALAVAVTYADKMRAESQAIKEEVTRAKSK